MLRTGSLACLLVAFAPAHSSLQMPSQETEEPETVIDARFPVGVFGSGPLPIRLVHGTRIYVPAQVNKHQVSALLDTGAAWTVLDQRFAQQLGVQSEGYRTTRGTGGTAPSRYARGVSLDLGQLRLRNVTALVMDLSDVERRLGISLPVIVGPEAFSTVVADLDVPQKQVTFWQRDRWRPPPGARKVVAQAVEGVRSVPLSVEGRPEAMFVMDIGNGRTPLMVYPHYDVQENVLAGRPTSLAMSGAIGGERPVATARLNSIRFAGWSFRDVPAQFPKDGPTASRRSLAGNVGMPLLGRFRIITNFAENAIWVLPGATISREFERDRSGVTFTYSDENLTIRALAGPATASGLAVGDRIIAVRRRGRRWTPVKEAQSWNTQPAGVTVELKLASGAIKHLTLRNYF